MGVTRSADRGRCNEKHKSDNYKEGPNLLPNPGLEQLSANGLPEGWKRRDYGGRPANQSAEWTSVNGEGNVHGGEKAVRCTSRGDADTSLYVNVQ